MGRDGQEEILLLFEALTGARGQDAGGEGLVWSPPRRAVQEAFMRRHEILGLLATSGGEFLEGPAQRRLELIQQHIHAYNQFIALEGQASADMLRGCRELLAACAQALGRAESAAQLEAELSRLLERQRQELAPMILAAAEQSGVLAEDADTGVGAAVCHQYSPATQLEVLGIRTAGLMQPILDLGCGEKGELVKHLRGLGLEALGLDRQAPESLMRGDWLDYRPEPGAWGTVISHMAFSNHFIHHHLNPQGREGDYARLFEAILASLKPGGSFYYAPGLPFMEDGLPAEYELRRTPVQSPPALAHGETGPGVALTMRAFGYASQVRRRPGPA